ncbi:MAG: sigma-70 family RNA polymerase sigma factor [Spirochaetes bacterium]|nr:sigma-70 family RNA polymerase sigma factor [Spirochaetota bacterium]
MEKGKGDAMIGFLERHMALMRRLARAFCQTSGILGCHDADDIVQDACLKLFRLGPRGLAELEHEAAYVKRVVVTCGLDYARRQKRHFEGRREAAGENAMDLLPDPRSAAPEEGLPGVELREAVRGALGGLRPLTQTIGRKFFIEGRTEREIGRHLGKAQSTVAGHVDVARRLLRDALRRRYPGELAEYFE